MDRADELHREKWIPCRVRQNPSRESVTLGGLVGWKGRLDDLRDVEVVQRPKLRHACVDALNDPVYSRIGSRSSEQESHAMVRQALDQRLEQRENVGRRIVCVV